ncbi:ketoreductase, putative [Trichomonas vaginalis G3]|uniref:Ketoreductase, putative n=1 Tax=Trichomonas vaginalis (strain ATCC PRA-98 / G3) TaxID=412133 RepID=A2FTB9_TRIV3|nr:oxidation-reduction process [Trichomonas vaginalis G3]EAX91839.1 ketoreductase, putative [Trichomonas vaginalis G3]KAI5512627.1 oxidation-reduction process [Trichomonas vaginalis G3]|eukprot:XP_001304769.1 ketoreductase [Trichomonas vaginalis G3]
MRHFIKFTAAKGINSITFNCVHPGSTPSNLGRESTKFWLFSLINFLWTPMMNSMEDAARPSITCELVYISCVLRHCAPPYTT